MGDLKDTAHSANNFILGCDSKLLNFLSYLKILINNLKEL
jgi:hypothetical protein